MPNRPRLASISTRQARIAELAKQMPGTALTSLSHHLDQAWFHEAYKRTRKDGSTGVDGQTGEEYSERLGENLQSLEDRAKSGRYRAPAVRRVHIPKGDGSETRPIGVPTFEDKVLQRAVVMALEPVYEEEFYDFSYGFRPGRSAHDALESLNQAIHSMGGGWVLDVDIRDFFGSLDRAKARELLGQRVADGVLVRLVGKWLQAGVLEDGVLKSTETGTPQGGVISPLLANIYLHEGVDRWWVEQVVPRMRGRVFLIRYADDIVMVFSEKSDALRVQEVLPKRLGRYCLELNAEKTRLVPFRRPRSHGGPRPGSFDFLGFTHYWGRSRRGRWILKRKTAAKRFSRALKALNQWMCRAHHAPVCQQAAILDSKLRGHFNYYGIRGNSNALGRFRYEAGCLWRKWLSRRSQRARMPWEKFNQMLHRYPLPPARLAPQKRQFRLANL